MRVNIPVTRVINYFVVVVTFVPTFALASHTYNWMQTIVQVGLVKIVNVLCYIRTSFIVLMRNSENLFSEYHFTLVNIMLFNF